MEEEPIRPRPFQRMSEEYNREISAAGKLLYARAVEIFAMGGDSLKDKPFNALVAALVFFMRDHVPEGDMLEMIQVVHKILMTNLEEGE